MNTLCVCMRVGRFPLRGSRFNGWAWMLALIILSALWIAACSPPVERPTGAAGTYLDATDMFKRGRYDRALVFTEGLASASPPNAYTDRARVLRAVILTGQMNGYKELGDAYAKGVDAIKDPQHKGEYGRLRHDDYQYASQLALGLGQVAQQMTAGGSLPKELALEATYPTIEGPMMVSQLERVKEGGWIGQSDQEQAALDAPRAGVDDALAEVVRGDRFKAQSAMKAGPVKLDPVDFGIFLANGVLNGATLFDRKHTQDPQKFRLVYALAQSTAKATEDALKANSDPDKQKRLKKLEDDIKAESKNGYPSA